jgi:hypothetical protein
VPILTLDTAGRVTAVSTAAVNANAAAPVAWVAGNFVCPVNVSVGGGGAIVANTIYLTPFVPPVSFTFSELGARIFTAAAGSDFQLAIYGSSGSLPAGDPIGSTASISGAVAAALSNSASGTLLAGRLYWMACNQTSSSLVYQVISSGSTYQGFVLGSTSLSVVSSSTLTGAIWRQHSFTFGTWPDLTGVATTEASSGQRGPLIYTKIGAIL